ncbi:MAG: rRNA pseudouridine synthase [Roseburia sp.]|nr:rRNA pseudouridine synthase [Anaeroplasma bactoclasticum]MCM1195869.1 rRNA pseudouridine synthase [Roseburia sp.]MCM1556543.1 rRNA pseudouridine synthase [Anaeroplasma bactoclasticum]
MNDNKERLQKVMASCGVAARRKCEEIILAGRVFVNGVKVTELGTKVSSKDYIEVDGKQINKDELVYYVMYKPTGYITSVSDKHGRRIVMDLIPQEIKKSHRLFPIGRLDYDTSGVLLITNDGKLSYRLTRSAKEIEKVYQVRVDGILTQEAVNHLIKGIMLDGVMTKRAKVEVLSMDRTNASTLLNLTITEGRNRQVRRMCEAIGFPVKKLKRVSFGGVTLDGLAKGELRALKPHEIKVLYSL